MAISLHKAIRQELKCRRQSRISTSPMIFCTRRQRHWSTDQQSHDGVCREAKYAFHKVMRMLCRARHDLSEIPQLLCWVLSKQSFNMSSLDEKERKSDLQSDLTLELEPVRVCSCEQRNDHGDDHEQASLGGWRLKCLTMGYS